MSTTSPSRVYTQAAGVAPITCITAASDSWCVMCGTPIATGDACNPLQDFGPTFNNHIDLRALSGRYICGDCAALRGKEWLQTYSKTYACSTGFFKLASNEDYAAFVLSPPEPPFVAVLSTAKQQHLIWRAPVNASRDWLLIRMGDEVLSIRRAVVMQALSAYKALVHLMATVPTERGYLLKGPPAIFDRELANSAMGSLRIDVAAHATANGMHDQAALFGTLTMGEWWALNALRFIDLDHPPQPVKLTFETSAERKLRKDAESAADDEDR